MPEGICPTSGHFAQLALCAIGQLAQSARLLAVILPNR